MQEQSKQVRHADTDWPHKVPLCRRDGLLVAYALVDGSDLPGLMALTWRFTEGYALHNALRMHRVLLGLQRGDPREGDHINGDKIDNRRSNLRIVTFAQQRQNLNLRADNRSGYRGVTWNTERQLWKARVRTNNREHFLGWYADPHEAGRVTAEYRRLHVPFSVDR